MPINIDTSGFRSNRNWALEAAQIGETSSATMMRGLQMAEMMGKMRNQGKLQDTLQQVDPMTDEGAAAIARINPEVGMALRESNETSKVRRAALSERTQKAYQSAAIQAMEMLRVSGSDDPGTRQRILSDIADHLESMGVEKPGRIDLDTWPVWEGIARAAGYVSPEEQTRRKQQEFQAMTPSVIDRETQAAQAQLPLYQAKYGMANQAALDRARSMSDIYVERAKQIAANRPPSPMDQVYKYGMDTSPTSDASVAVEGWANSIIRGKTPKDIPKSGTYGGIMTTRIRSAVNKKLEQYGIGYDDLLRNEQKFAAESSVIKDLEKRQALTETFEMTADKAFTMALDAAKTLQDTGIPATNSIRNWMQTNTGDPRVAVLNQHLFEAKMEYVKAVTGALGIAQPTAGMLDEANQLFSIDDPVPVLTAKILAARKNIGNRVQAFADAREASSQRLAPALGTMGAEPGDSIEAAKALYRSGDKAGAVEMLKRLGGR